MYHRHRQRMQNPQINPTTIVLFCRLSALREKENTSIMLVIKYVRHKSVILSLAMAITLGLSDKIFSIGSANKTNTEPKRILTAVA